MDSHYEITYGVSVDFHIALAPRCTTFFLLKMLRMAVSVNTLSPDFDTFSNPIPLITYPEVLTMLVGIEKKRS